MSSPQPAIMPPMMEPENLEDIMYGASEEQRQFTTVAWTWSITLAKSNALDQGIASLGQTRPIISRLQALDDLKSDLGLKQDGATIPLGNEVDFLASKEWRFRQAAAIAHAVLGEANDLSLAAMNEASMVDLDAICPPWTLRTKKGCR
ncbi:hypothetical protein B0T09DRAFT_361365 [Sordaria sp. MPI-SDFR-AT-0083]|nr:hypothetical protein B0T09DRAFT_361365 [Sordaria sp. MPI-SDFR-AT-0083]